MHIVAHLIWDLLEHHCIEEGNWLAASRYGVSQGADWFESALVDYDVCSNWGNWVAAAGLTGAHMF